MARSMLIVIVVGALLGFGASQLWGAGTGVGLAVLVMLIGAVTLVLRRNQTDLRDLEQGKVPREIDDALGDDSGSSR